MKTTLKCAAAHAPHYRSRANEQAEPQSAPAESPAESKAVFGVQICKTLRSTTGAEQMSDEKPKYPYAQIPRGKSRLTEGEQKRLAEFMPEWEATFLEGAKNSGGFTEWLKKQLSKGRKQP
jgi:hypothetical protein